MFAAVAVAVPALETIHEAARDVAEAEAIIGHGVRKTPRHQKIKEEKRKKKHAITEVCTLN